ncbi:MAG: DUF4863 family protein [Methylocystaceae bacterium]|nr:DUF4863 family protein [Methylocystaceae bacterium]
MENLQELVAEITHVLQDKPVTKELQNFLNDEFPPESDVFQQIQALCKRGMEEGWLGKYEAEGLRYGRVIKPSPQTHGHSVDVVLMKDMKGPYHIHPTGEIDMVFPLDETAAFDGQGLGWKVYSAGSGHYPTVRGGEAIVLYLLPNGEIEFTKPK